MKRTQLTLIAVLTLLMTGCGNRSEDSSTPHYLSNNGGGTSALPLSSTSSSSSSSTVLSTSKDGGKTSSSNGSSPYEDSPWPSEIVDLMMEHLGGEAGILPYVFLGSRINGAYYPESQTYGEHRDPYVGIIGSTEWDDSILSNAKAAFKEEDGWVSVISGTTFTAVNENLHLRVIIEKEDQYPVLRAYYEEPFDPSTGTSWKDETIQKFDDYLGGHHLPYFYIGTTDETTTDPTESSFYIVGGKWNPDVLSLAETAFEQDNQDGIAWKIDDEDGSGNKSDTHLIAEKTYADGFRVKVTIGFETSEINPNYGKTIVHVEFFAPYKLPDPADRVWPKDVQAEMTSHFGVVFPYIYLGTTAGFTTEWKSYGHILQIQSYVGYREEVLPSIQQQFENDTEHHWVTEYHKGETAGELDTVTATASFDGYDFYVTAGYSFGDGYALKIQAVPSYNPNHASHDWQESTKQQFTDHLDGYQMPYLYLGTEQESADYMDYYKYIQIQGGAYDDRILSDVEATLKKDNADGSDWTIEANDPDTNTFKANKVVSNGTKLITLEISYDEGTHFTFLRIRFSDYVKKNWSDKVIKAFDEHLGGYHLPYLSLSVDDPYVSGEDNTVTISEADMVEFDDMKLSSFKKTLEGDGWTMAYGPDDEFGPTLSGSKETSGKKYTILIHNTDGGDIDAELYSGEIIIKMTEAFAAPSEEDSHWTSDVESTLSTFLGNEDKDKFPYVYLGTLTPTATVKGNILTITGLDYDSRILALANTAFTEAKFSEVETVSDEDFTYGYFTLSSGVKAPVAVRNQKGIAELFVFKPNLSSTWSTDTKQHLKDHFNDYPLPYMDLGTNDPAEDPYPNVQHDLFNFPTYDLPYLLHAKSVLEDDGFTCEFKSVTGGALTLESKKDTTDYTYQINFKRKWNSTLNMETILSDVFLAPTGDDVKWSDKVEANFKQLFPNGNPIPYIYLGAKDIDSYYYDFSNEVILYGGTFNAQVFALAQQVLEEDNTKRKADIDKDPSQSWTYQFDKNFSQAKNEEGAFTATRKDSTGKTITIRIFKKNGDDRIQMNVVYE